MQLGMGAVLSIRASDKHSPELNPCGSFQVIFSPINPKEWELDSKREYKAFAYPKLAKHIRWEV